MRPAKTLPWFCLAALSTTLACGSPPGADGAALSAPEAAEPSADGEARPGAREEASQPAEAKILRRFRAGRAGEVTILDEEPGAARPALAVLITSGDGDQALPLRHGDGSDVTPYEYLVAFAPGEGGVGAERIRQHHLLETGSLAVKDVAPAAVPWTQPGSCDENLWENYFTSQAIIYGLPVPTYAYNQSTTAPSYTAYGNLGTFGKIAAGVCFAGQSDGHDDLEVRMERRLGAGAWSTIAGTARTLHTTIEGGHRRYVYKTSSLCNNYSRRVAVVGSPGSGGSGPDRFHLGGAWAPTGCLAQ